MRGIRYVGRRADEEVKGKECGGRDIMEVVQTEEIRGKRPG